MSEVDSALNAVGSIMDFELFPFGNARQTQEGSTWVFSCQHGKNECIANMYQACAMSHYNGTTAGIPNWWPMVVCMEKSNDPVSAASDCATSGGIDWSVITTCAGADPANGSPTDGNLLMHAIATATENLVPAHQWTPWVVLNGKPLSSSALDKSLTSLVCDAYTGTKPSGCTKMSEKLILRD